MTEAPTSNAITSERLRKVNPFSRHVWQRGQDLYPALRRQLIRENGEGLDDLGLRVSLCLRMTAAFHSGDALDKVRTALVRRYDPNLVHVPYVASLNHQRRFDEGLRYAAQLSRSEPGSIGARLLLIDQFFIAGFPGKGIQTIKRSLGEVFQHNRQQAHKLVRMFGIDLRRAFIEMGILKKLLAQVAAGTPTDEGFGTLMRARRNHGGYLRGLLAELVEQDRPYLTALLCRNVLSRMPAPRFRQRLDALEKAEREGLVKLPPDV